MAMYVCMFVYVCIYVYLICCVFFLFAHRDYWEMVSAEREPALFNEKTDPSKSFFKFIHASAFLNKKICFMLHSITSCRQYIITQMNAYYCSVKGCFFLYIIYFSINYVGWGSYYILFLLFCLLIKRDEVLSAPAPPTEL